jgi:hypothetical protein
MKKVGASLPMGVPGVAFSTDVLTAALATEKESHLIEDEAARFEACGSQLYDACHSQVERLLKSIRGGSRETGLSRGMAKHPVKPSNT